MSATELRINYLPARQSKLKGGGTRSRGEGYEVRKYVIEGHPIKGVDRGTRQIKTFQTLDEARHYARENYPHAEVDGLGL